MVPSLQLRVEIDVSVVGISWGVGSSSPGQLLGPAGGLREGGGPVGPQAPSISRLPLTAVPAHAAWRGFSSPLCGHPQLSPRSPEPHPLFRHSHGFPLFFDRPGPRASSPGSWGRLTPSLLASRTAHMCPCPRLPPSNMLCPAGRLAVKSAPLQEFARCN